MLSDLTGTIESSRTIQPVIYRAAALFSRHFKKQWHYSTGTIQSDGTIQPTQYRAVALFNWHFTEQWHYSVGIIQTSGTTQPALYRPVALLNWQYRETLTVTRTTTHPLRRISEPVFSTTRADTQRIRGVGNIWSRTCATIFTNCQDTCSARTTQ